VVEDENYDLSSSPIDEDARGAINVEFSTAEEYHAHLLESESDIIQPVEISYKLLTASPVSR
jgi:hypothetical protein